MRHGSGTIMWWVIIDAISVIHGGKQVRNLNRGSYTSGHFI